MNTLTIKQVKILNLLKKAQDCADALSAVRAKLENDLAQYSLKEAA